MCGIFFLSKKNKKLRFFNNTILIQKVQDIFNLGSNRGPDNHNFIELVMDQMHM